MAILLLPNAEYLRQCFDYDPKTGVMRWRERPRAHFADARAFGSWNGKYAGRAVSSRPTLDEKSYLVHRLIWKWVTGEEPPPEIDHRNVNRSDTRWENFRAATRAQNVANSRRRRIHKVGLKGVTLKKGRFQASITVAKKTIWLGSFKTAEEAHAAYCEAAHRHYREFARTA